MEAPSLPFATMTDDEVTSSLRKYSIGLTVDEARKIESFLGRAPTVVEAVIWGIQGSEHCSYKSSRRFLKMFPTSGRNVILGPGEDSGIVAVTDGPAGKRWGIVVSHESHNHPSQVVPFEGAATGVGGTVRDVACMGARVIGCMDLLRLGDLEKPASRAIAKEVIRGIGGYGNPLGVPNLGGDTVFDPAYDSNCLVNAIAIGMVREDEIIHSFVPEEAAREGYDIILVGKPTDRSGFGGAAFASVIMEEEKKEQNTGAVQEPNPFLERHLLVSTYALFDWIIANGALPKVSFKDLGAGGVVCSSVEQVASRGYGADVDLGKVHVSIKGLPSEVIACAETQERFCWMCHPSLTAQILKHYNEDWKLPEIAEGARASVIGKVNGSGRFRLTHNGVVVCDAKSKDITEGLQYVRPTAKPDMPRSEPQIRRSGERLQMHNGFTTKIKDVFIQMLRHPNHGSKKAVINGFDKTVIGNSLIEAGEADASVITPFRDLDSYLPGGTHPGWSDPSIAHLGVAFAGDGNPRYGKISAYLQGANAAVESICNVVAVGAVPRALTDCLNYGNPEVPAQLGALEQGVKGIADACRALPVDGEPVPVISGNVSLYNSVPDGSAIPPSAIVCCIGVLPDARKAVTMQLKKAGSALIVLGARRDECGGSAYYEVLEKVSSAGRDALIGANVPVPDYAAVLANIRLVLQLADEGTLLACHDISDGGLALALLEMTLPCRKMGGRLGVSADVAAFASDLPYDVLLFSQTQGFVLEVSQDEVASVLEKASALRCTAAVIGMVTDDSRFTLRGNGDVLVQETLEALRTHYEDGPAQALAGR